MEGGCRASKAREMVKNCVAHKFLLQNPNIATFFMPWQFGAVLSVVVIACSNGL